MVDKEIKQLVLSEDECGELYAIGLIVHVRHRDMCCNTLSSGLIRIFWQVNDF